MIGGVRVILPRGETGCDRSVYPQSQRKEMLTHTHTVHAQREVLLRRRSCSRLTAERSNGNACKKQKYIFKYMHTFTHCCGCAALQISNKYNLRRLFREFEGHLICCVYFYNTGNPVHRDTLHCKEHEL